MLHPASRLLGVLAAALVLVTTGCAAAVPEQRLTAEPVADTAVTGIEYWSDGTDTLLLDACLPDGEAPASGHAAVVLLHGGGFTSGSRSTGGTSTICALMARYGVAGFAIDYRLAPAARYPAQVEDVDHALEWLREDAQIERFGIDPDRIGLLGSSAGAIIAQSVATAGQGSGRLKAVVSLSGVADMTPAARSLGEPSDEVQQIVLQYLGCTDVTRCQQAEDASAIRQVDATDPPMLLVTGSAEIVPAQQATAMAEALEDVGVPVQVVVRPGDAHGFGLLDTTARTAVRDFLSEHL